MALFMMHGAIYGAMKTEGRLHDKMRGWAMNCIIAFVICAVTTTMATLLCAMPHIAARVPGLSVVVQHCASPTCWRLQTFRANFIIAATGRSLPLLLRGHLITLMMTLFGLNPVSQPDFQPA